jgi:hypothetical protein
VRSKQLKHHPLVILFRQHAASMSPSCWIAGSMMKGTAADGELDRQDRDSSCDALSPVELGPRADRFLVKKLSF